MAAYIEELLVERLTGNAAAAALIGERVYPGALPQNAVYPAVRYTLVSRTEKLVKPADSGLGAQLNIVRSRFQLDVYAKTYGGAKAVAKALRGAVRGWQDPANGVIVARVDDDGDAADGEESMQRLSMDVVIVHNE